MAITAITGQTLQDTSASSIRDFINLTPGVTIVSGGAESNVNVTIRGISDLSGGLGDPDVAVFIDGVYQSNRGAISIGLLDLLRVEIIKGPVSALYGRNAYAGVINYVTTPPQQQLEGTASVTFGDYGKRAEKVSIGGALGSPALLGRLVASHDEFAGTFRDSVNGQHAGGYRKDDFLGGLTAKPTDRLTIDGSFYYGNDFFDVVPYAVNTNNCGPLSTSTLTPGPVHAVLRPVQSPPAAGPGQPDQSGIRRNGQLPLGEHRFAALQLRCQCRRRFRAHRLRQRQTEPTQHVLRQPQRLAVSRHRRQHLQPRDVFRPAHERRGHQHRPARVDEAEPAAARIRRPVRVPRPVQPQHVVRDRRNASACRRLGDHDVRPVQQCRQPDRQPEPEHHDHQPDRSHPLAVRDARIRRPAGTDGRRRISPYPAEALLRRAGEQQRARRRPPAGSRRYDRHQDQLRQLSRERTLQAHARPDRLRERGERHEGGRVQPRCARRVRTRVRAGKQQHVRSRHEGHAAGRTGRIRPVPVQDQRPQRADLGTVERCDEYRARHEELRPGPQRRRGHRPVGQSPHRPGRHGRRRLANPKLQSGTYDFSSSDVANCRVVAACASRIVANAPSPQGPRTAIDLGGLQLPRASKTTISTSVQYNGLFTQDWGYFARADYRRETKQYEQTYQFSTIAPRNTVNLNAGVTSDHYRLSAYVKNLTNNATPEVTAQNGYVGGGVNPYVAILPDGRTFGVTAEFKY